MFIHKCLFRTEIDPAPSCVAGEYSSRYTKSVVVNYGLLQYTVTTFRQHHNYQPINVPTAGAQGSIVDYT
jgi:hypothetical protein